VFFAVVAGGLLAVALVDPATGWTPPCPSRAALGLPCPGCGTLRGLHELAHGRVAAALRLNPLTISLLMVAPVAWLSRRPLGAWVERRPGRRRVLWIVAALVVLAFGAARLVWPGVV
jgi:hypothetical protein